jgi:hypothetical protein
MRLSQDVKEFIELMNSHEVEYLVVGGWAFSFHAIPRFTGDFDFFVRLNRENEERPRLVLFEFGFTDLLKPGQQFLRKGRVFRVGETPARIDLLTEIDGVPFERAWIGRMMGELDGVTVPFIGRSELIDNKLAAGRTKDLADVEQLKSTKAEGE